MTDWYEIKFPEKPKEQELRPDGTFAERRNLHQAPDGEWAGQERLTDPATYRLLTAMRDVQIDRAIDDYTEQLIEEGIL